MAFACSNLIVIWSTWTIDLKLFLTIVLGFIVLGILIATGTAQRPFEVRAGAWLIPWLAGLAVISYLSGDLDGEAPLSFGLSCLVTVLFSLAIYAVAIRSRLDASSMNKHIEDVQHEAALSTP